MGRVLTLALGLFALEFAALPPLVWSQAPARVPRLGVLTSGGGCHPGPPTTAFLEGLKAHGYVPAQSIDIECRMPGTLSHQEFGRLATELVRLNVDLIFAVSSAAVRAVRSATRTIPTVALDLETDPVGSGLAASLARPGGNITGIFLDERELNAKWLELLRGVMPQLSRVAALWDATTDRTPLRGTEAAVRSLGIHLQVLAVRSPGDLDAAFRTATKERVDAVLVMQSPSLATQRKTIADLALRNRLPTINNNPRFARDDGGLMSFGPDVDRLFKYAAVFVDRVLKGGARPAEIPIERPTHFYFVINLKTAKTLGLTVPPALLQRADEVIQ